jgi:hypothetical protein
MRVPPTFLREPFQRELDKASGTSMCVHWIFVYKQQMPIFQHKVAIRCHAHAVNCSNPVHRRSISPYTRVKFLAEIERETGPDTRRFTRPDLCIRTL